jgi:hypothetical protein
MLGVCLGTYLAISLRKRQAGILPISKEGGCDMIRISKEAIEELKGTHSDGKKNLLRVFISGLG